MIRGGTPPSRTRRPTAPTASARTSPSSSTSSLRKDTVEERMLELQQRKKALAAGIYDAAGGSGGGLEAGDIERLFEPLGS